MRLYAVLLLHACPGGEINQWLSDVLSKERSADSKNVLLWALSRRNETVLEIAGVVLEKLDGPGQTAIKPSRSNLADYLDRLKMSTTRRPLRGPARPSGKGGFTSRVGHAARDVALLLNGPERERLLSFMVEVPIPKGRSPLKAAVKAERDAAVATGSLARDGERRARNTARMSRERQAGAIERATTRVTTAAQKRAEGQVAHAHELPRTPPPPPPRRRPAPLCCSWCVVARWDPPLPTHFLSVSDHSYHQAERESRKRAKVTAKAVAMVREAHVAANDAADARVASDLNRARARARVAEKTSAENGRKLSRHTATVKENEKFRVLLNEREDEAQRERERADELEEHAGAALKMMDGMPDLAPVGRKAPAVIRKMICHMIARRTPPSAVVPNIVAVLKYVAPSLLDGAHLPNVDFVRKVRREMGRTAKTLAASRLARATNVETAHVDGSSLDQHETVAVGVIADGKHITLDASRTAIGKTAELEAQSFEDTFIDLAQMLGDWHDESEAAGVDAATRAAVGASSEVGLHRVRKPVTDNCAQALKMASIICGKIVAAVEQHHRDNGTWEGLSADEKKKELATFAITCHNHLRNILVKRGAKASTARLKDLLDDELGRIPKDERIVADADALVRSIWKEFCSTHKNYAKGQGYKNFTPWLRRERVGSLFLAPPRGDCGSRHDFSTSAAMLLYHDRTFFVDFLQTRLWGDKNILEDAVYVMLGCVEIVAEIRARAIIHDKLVEPLVFFCCSKALAWGPLNMSAVYNTLEKTLMLVVENPSMLIDSELDVFAAFDDQPAYAEWKKAKENETARLVRPLETAGETPADTPALEPIGNEDDENHDDEDDDDDGDGDDGDGDGDDDAADAAAAADAALRRPSAGDLEKKKKIGIPPNERASRRV